MTGEDMSWNVLKTMIYYLWLWLEQNKIFRSTWLSSAQNFFIPVFLMYFCDKIHRAHTVLARSKLFEEKSLVFHWIKISYFNFTHIHIYLYCPLIYQIRKTKKCSDWVKSWISYNILIIYYKRLINSSLILL